MSLVKELFGKHKVNLQKHSAALISQLLERESAIESFQDTPDLSHALIKIEPVASEQPVQLFGQSVPSVACSKLSLHVAVPNPDGGFLPGKHIISALISDQGLCNLTMNMNSSRKVPLTVTDALGEVLPTYLDARKDPISAVIQTAKEKGNGVNYLSESVNSFIKATQKGVISKSACEKMLSVLDALYANSKSDQKFYLERVMEGLAKAKSEAQTEISNAIAAQFNTLKGTLALPDMSQEAPSRAMNAMVDALMGYETMDEREALQELVMLELQAIVLDYDLTIELEGNIDPHGKQITDALRFRSDKFRELSKAEQNSMECYAKNLCWMRNGVENKHVLEGRAQDSLHCIMLESSSVTGSTRELFSEYSINDDRFIELRFSNGYEEINEFGEHRLSDTDSLLEVRIIHEDLMNALRGHVNGGYVQCTISRMMGKSLDLELYMNKEQAEIMKQNIGEVSDKVIELKCVFDQLKERLSNKISRKSEKEEAIELLSKFSELYAECSADQIKVLESKAEQLKGMASRDLNRSMKQSLEHLGLTHDSVVKQIQKLV